MWYVRIPFDQSRSVSSVVAWMIILTFATGVAFYTLRAAFDIMHFYQEALLPEEKSFSPDWSQSLQTPPHP